VKIENYKTTLGGLLSAFGAALVLAPLPDDYKWVPSVLSAFGLALLGITAKDSTTHSTTTQVAIATAEKKAEVKAEVAEAKKK